MIPLIPVAIVGLTGIAAWQVHKRSTHQLNPEQRRMYEAALATLKDPEKLNKLADAFEQQGFPKEADLLRKRAALRTAPEETKLQRKEVFRKAMASTNQAAVLSVAEAFDAIGANGAAATLRQYAAGLKKPT